MPFGKVKIKTTLEREDAVILMREMKILIGAYQKSGQEEKAEKLDIVLGRFTEQIPSIQELRG